ncbi:MAG TPA: hypothetical protein DCE42_21160 [Myxococcales bacterium]|nr:hypothetical protein [Deltaproteobacteria bacterium]MBK07416.1 hypothetical protein [Deltaproteobacteria bacterium]MBU48851.1 hypothetical protein [Deltaproteobacteria bacterium]HAA57289.1 hypothetical protein [Myxococcales bacterium]
MKHKGINATPYLLKRLHAEKNVEVKIALLNALFALGLPRAESSTHGSGAHRCGHPRVECAFTHEQTDSLIEPRDSSPVFSWYVVTF